jgi:hypothetical protein
MYVWPPEGLSLGLEIVVAEWVFQMCSKCVPNKALLEQEGKLKLREAFRLVASFT